MALGVCVIVMTKYLTESDLKMEGCLGSEFEDTAHHDREGIAADWVPSTVRKCEDDSGSQLTFSFVPFYSFTAQQERWCRVQVSL